MNHMKKAQCAAALSALILVGASLMGSAQVQKGKNCFWSWHSGVQNWCQFSQEGDGCVSYCVRDRVWFGECQRQSGYQCQETVGPTYVIGGYVTCAPTLLRRCVCNTEWNGYTGWFYGRTCVGGPVGGGR